MRSRIFRILYFIFAFIVYTSYKAVQLWPSQPVVAVFLAILFFACMLTGIFAYRARPNIFDEPWFRVMSWVGSLSMALWASFVLISLPIDIFHLITFIFGINILPPDIYLYVFISAFVLTALGLLQFAAGPKTRNVEVKIQNLHPSLKNLRIAQISDLHVSTTIRKNYVEKVVRMTNEIEPDLIFLTGDIADAHIGSIDKHLEPLKKLKAKYGCYFVMGNHEYYWEPKAISEKFHELGVIVLNNENRIIQIGDAKVMVAGVTDPAGAQILKGHKPNPQQALASSQKVDLKILLAHRPDACNEAEKHGANLQFSGHTHAGQFFPFSLFIGLAHKYNRGLYRHGQMWVYVNPGTGYWGPANRLGVTAEITKVECTA